MQPCCQGAVGHIELAAFRRRDDRLRFIWLIRVDEARMEVAELGVLAKREPRESALRDTVTNECPAPVTGETVP